MMAQARNYHGLREDGYMAQRIMGIADAEAVGAVRELFDSSNQLLGRTANLMRILAHSPHLAKWLLPFIAAVRQPAAGAVSDVRLRNLAVLKTSTINDCLY
jgi:alkylhydroperoxidase family enzyme